MNIIGKITDITESNKQQKFIEFSKKLSETMEIQPRVYGIQEFKREPCKSFNKTTCQDITVNVKNVTEKNRRDKYIKAVSVVAKSLNIPFTIRKKNKEQGEEFPYQSYKELTQRYSRFFGYILDEVYKTACNALDLPEIKEFSKSQQDDIKPFIYKGKIFYSPQTGEPISVRDWKNFISAIEKFISQNTADLAEKMVLDSRTVGNLMQRMIKYQKWDYVKNVGIKDIEYHGKDFQQLAEYRKHIKEFDIKELEKKRIEIAKMNCAQNITKISDQIRNSIQGIFIDGIQTYTPKSKISQKLFDSFGNINRDWQRIVETETSNNVNTAFVAREVEKSRKGEKVYFQRMEIIDDATCPFCKQINGMVVLHVKNAQDSEEVEDKYAKIAIWDGKSNVGRKQADYWVAMGAMHPYCRGSWSRWYASEDDTEYDAAIAAMQNRQVLWGKAVDTARKEYEQQGIKNPNDRTAGYTDRINEVFKELTRK